MRRVVIGSEVGAVLPPGFGGLHQVRHSRRPFRITEPAKYAAYGFLALLVFAGIGHLH